MPIAVFAASENPDGSPRLDDKLWPLQPGFHLDPNERVLIVNDISTTGTSLRSLTRVANSRGCEIAGICVFSGLDLLFNPLAHAIGQGDIHAGHGIFLNVDSTRTLWQRMANIDIYR